MRLVSFEGGFGRVLEGDVVIPMGADLVAYLATGEATDDAPVALADVRLLAPVPRPGKLIGIGIGLNHRDHAAESGQPIPEAPIQFPKFANSVVGPGPPIVLEPGDLIATGTPPGVGFARKPRVWLRDGDEVSVEVERIGTLTNPVRAGR
jgi:2-keto-4-pentenoate hydratase/2-oxohepta-3-ene-1,7-dioic acid hydratase in catechol pathway